MSQHTCKQASEWWGMLQIPSSRLPHYGLNIQKHQGNLPKLLFIYSLLVPQKGNNPYKRTSPFFLTVPLRSPPAECVPCKLILYGPYMSCHSLFTMAWEYNKFFSSPRLFRYNLEALIEWSFLVGKWLCHVQHSTFFNLWPSSSQYIHSTKTNNKWTSCSYLSMDFGKNETSIPWRQLPFIFKICNKYLLRALIN